MIINTLNCNGSLSERPIGIGNFFPRDPRIVLKFMSGNGSKKQDVTPLGNLELPED